MRWWVGVLCSGVVSIAPAAQVAVDGVRTRTAPDHTRVVFDLDGPVEHNLFMLRNPDRVVVDLHRARLGAAVARPPRSDKLLRRIRAASRPRGDLRVVLDLRGSVRPKSFQLRPNDAYGHRLVVDLYPRDGADAVQPVTLQRVMPGQPRDVVVVIDPGHGGEDPGAVGKHGTFEKDVVLSVAKRLQGLIEGEPGMRAFLTRSGDYYVRLRKRMDIARAHGADLFVSLHADAFRDPRVKGATVYILSRNGASSEAARWLAERENAADLVGGVTLDDKDEVLASVLLDLSQTASISASTEVATRVLGELSVVGKTHKRFVERAGFLVLKSPDIPSILVETTFISNPSDEKRLLGAKFQRDLARAMLRGVQAYFRRNPPPETVLAGRTHVITRGDTLSQIASRYGTTIKRLRSANKLSGSRIREGAVLRIPATSL